jgi:hypothetical protein
LLACLFLFKDKSEDDVKQKSSEFFFCVLFNASRLFAEEQQRKNSVSEEGKNCNEKTTKQRFFGFGLLYDSENMLKLKSKTIKRGLMSMEYPGQKNGVHFLLGGFGVRTIQTHIAVALNSSFIFIYLDLLLQK